MARRSRNLVEVQGKVTGDVGKKMKAAGGEVKAATDKMSKATDKLAKSQKKAKTMGDKFKAGLKQIAIGALRQVGTAILQFPVRALAKLSEEFGRAIRAAMAFETAMAEVSTLVDTSTTDMAGLSQSVRDLSIQFGTSSVSQAKALYQAISAGATDAGQANAVMVAANKLALGGVTDIETAVDGLTSIMNAYGATTNEVGDISDRFFVAMRAGKTTVGELSQNIGTVAPIAKAAGISLDDLFASLSAITTGGIETNKAAIFLRQAFQTLLKPTKDATAEAKRLGIEFTSAGVKAQGGFLPFLQQIANSEKFTSESLGKLFGNVRAMTGVLSLLNNEGGKFASILEDMKNKAGSTDEAVAKMADTTQFLTESIAATGSEIERAFGEAITQSDEVQGALKELLTTMTALAKFMVSPAFIGRVQSAMSTFTKVVETTGDALEFTGRLLDQLTFEMTDFGSSVRGTRLAVSEFQREMNKNAGLELGIDRLAKRYFELSKGIDSIVVNKKLRARLVGELAETANKVKALARNVAKDELDVRAEVMKRVAELRRRDAEDATAKIRRRNEEEKAAAAEARKLAEETAKNAEANAKKASKAKLAQFKIDDAQRKVTHNILLDLWKDQAKKRKIIDREATKAAKEKAAEEQKIQDDADERRFSAMQGMASITGSLFNSAFQGIDAFKQRILGIFQQLAAKLLTSVVFKFLGTIFGAALGGAGSFLGQLFGGSIAGLAGALPFAKGGTVPRTPGSISGKDSVPAVLTPGEVVIPTDLVDTLRAVFGQMNNTAFFARGGVVGGGGKAPVNLTVVMQGGSGGQGPAGAKRIRGVERDVVKALKELSNSGRLQQALPEIF